MLSLEKLGLGDSFVYQEILYEAILVFSIYREKFLVISIIKYSMKCCSNAQCGEYIQHLTDGMFPCCPQKRYVLDETVEPPRIRAAQGHTVQLENPMLREVTNSSDVPLAIHVTSAEG